MKTLKNITLLAVTAVVLGLASCYGEVVVRDHPHHEEHDRDHDEHEHHEHEEHEHHENH